MLNYQRLIDEMDKIVKMNDLPSWARVHAIFDIPVVKQALSLLDTASQWKCYFGYAECDGTEDLTDICELIRLAREAVNEKRT